MKLGLHKVLCFMLIFIGIRWGVSMNRLKYTHGNTPKYITRVGLH